MEDSDVGYDGDTEDSGDDGNDGEYESAGDDEEYKSSSKEQECKDSSKEQENKDSREDGFDEWWGDIEGSFGGLDITAIMNMDMMDPAALAAPPTTPPVGEASPRMKLKLVLWMNGHRITD